jgi:hypothetical protein
MKYRVRDDKYIDFIKNIRVYFGKSTNCLYTGRNKLKVLTYQDDNLVVKSFKIPHFINKIAYTFLRDSKAERSYANSMKILEFVPKPIGYAEFKKYGLIHDCYFLCEKYPYDFTIREPLQEKNFPYKEIIFLQFAQFVYALHNKGVEHLDFSPGNILIKEIALQKYEFKIIDINRMAFKVFTKEERIQNFSKLWANDEDLMSIVKAYAPLINMNENRAMKIALEASDKHKQKKLFKKKLLKHIKPKKISGKSIEDIQKSIRHISVVIMVKNAEETIEECLDSLQLFGEVILYFNDSTDNTKEKIKKYKNIKIIDGNFFGFGKTKNKAATYSKNDWIFSLDSDEILNKSLLNELAQINFSDIKKIYRVKRNNYFLGYKTQDSDSIVRIYNRKFTSFNHNNVHEKVIVPKDAEVVTLKNSFKHLNITNINQTLTKMIQYTDLGSEGKKICFFSVVLAKSFFAFFKIYILKGNILKGWVGIVLGINAANRRYYKYLKQFINCKHRD